MRSVGRWASAGVMMLFSLLAAQDVFAWGDTGHHIICEIAFQELTPQARARVIELIQHDPNFMLFSKACTWADHPRTRASEHFVNLPRSAASIGDDPCPLDDICVVTAIDQDMAVLSQASASEMEKLTALKYLGHWVGDVHQPLHVSFTDDRGGNAIDEQGPCADNLHAVWDTCLIARTLGRDVRHIAGELRSRVTAAERAAWTDTGAKDWANESLPITTAETVRYGVRTETGGWDEADNEVLDLDEAKTVVTVDEASLDTHLPLVTQRLIQAGIRLSHLLNRALGGE
jgi:S1/P1 Nuclease